MTKSYTKLKHQVKSSRYYIFWGAATIAVMAGQIIEIKMELELLEKKRNPYGILPL